MTQYIEHYKCNDAPCIHVDPALPMAEFDYLIGLSPPKYPVPTLRTDNLYWRLPHLGEYWNGQPLTCWQLIHAWHLWKRG